MRPKLRHARHHRLRHHGPHGEGRRGPRKHRLRRGLRRHGAELELHGARGQRHHGPHEGRRRLPPGRRHGHGHGRAAGRGHGHAAGRDDERLVGQRGRNSAGRRSWCHSPGGGEGGVAEGQRQARHASARQDLADAAELLRGPRGAAGGAVAIRLVAGAPRGGREAEGGVAGVVGAEVVELRLAAEALPGRADLRMHLRLRHQAPALAPGGRPAALASAPGRGGARGPQQPARTAAGRR
mmetsp:Transcript_34155/g.97014  ORF Transcript_34155/g.97014 Transcript_34155/m.97014 type:complete len:239 (-) Transcript_34155:43-759(-)